MRVCVPKTKTKTKTNSLNEPLDQVAEHSQWVVHPWPMASPESVLNEEGVPWNEMPLQHTSRNKDG